VPVWPTQYAADTSCNLRLLRQWGDAKLLISGRNWRINLFRGMWVRFLVGRGQGKVITNYLQVKPVEQDIPEICGPCLRQELNMSLNWLVPCFEGLSWYLPSLVLAGGAPFLAFLWPSLLSSVWWFQPLGFYWIICSPFGIDLAMINWFDGRAGSYKSTRKAQNRNFLQYLCKNPLYWEMYSACTTPTMHHKRKAPN
jgi:hypothetical protein